MWIRAGNERGMTSVECALLLPLLLLFSLGLVESGNLFSDWLTVRKAAQCGARLAATGQGEEAAMRMALIRSEVDRVMDRLPGGASDVLVSSWPTAAAGGPGAAGDPGPPCGMVEVRVEYRYRPVTPLLEGLLGQSVLLAGSDRKVNEPWQRCD